MLGFYHDSIHNQIPMDRVEITGEQHRALLEANHSGKVIQADENGFPVAVDPKPQVKTPQQQIAAIEATITPRRLREFLLGAEQSEGWLKAQEAKITQFRSKIKNQDENR